MELAFGFLGWIIFGGIAGWLASKVMKTDEQMGIWANTPLLRRVAWVICGLIIALNVALVVLVLMGKG